MALMLVASVVEAQEQPSVTESRGLRIVWTVQPQTRDFTAVCGQIFNDTIDEDSLPGVSVRSDVDINPATAVGISDQARSRNDQACLCAL